MARGVRCRPGRARVLVGALGAALWDLPGAVAAAGLAERREGARSWLFGGGGDITPGKIREFAQKLRGSEESAAKLEAAIAEAQAKLKASEHAFADGFHSAASSQDDVWGLAKHAAANRQILAGVATGAAKLSMEVQELSADANRTDRYAKDTLNATKSVAERAVQLLSLGQIRGRTDGCLDAPDAKKDGEKVQVWTCGKAQESQQWTYDPASQTLKHQHGVCLAAPEGKTEAMMWTCDASLASQKWRYDHDKGLLTSLATGKCLAAEDQTKKGSAISMQVCSADDPGQQWAVIPGGASLRQQLDKVNEVLWDMEDPTSSNSLDAQERQMSILEQDTALFEALLAKKSRKVLLRRLRHRADRLRRAVKRLGDAASLGEPILGEEGPRRRGDTARVWGAMREDVFAGLQAM
mmetsp:Transcript_92394/g.258178  ORF Transcript_92394/g.258178 Transcript_92394/m.258178 type:complete len:410 (+) Transcript_92394:101-1330(+)